MIVRRESSDYLKEDLRKSRVKSVNVNGQIDRVLGTNTVANLLDDSSHANIRVVDLTSLDTLETAVAIVGVVRRTGEGSADSSVDVGVVGKKTLLMSVEEVGTVVDGSLLGR